MSLFPPPFSTTSCGGDGNGVEDCADGEGSLEGLEEGSEEDSESIWSLLTFLRPLTEDVVREDRSLLLWDDE